MFHFLLRDHLLQADNRRSVERACAFRVGHPSEIVSFKIPVLHWALEGELVSYGKEG